MTKPNNVVQMDQAAARGICMAYIRRGEHHFFPTNYTLNFLKAGKPMVKGELAPGRSSRACVVLINPGVSLSDIKNALDAALSHLERTKPGVVHGIAVPQKGKQLLFFTPRLELEAAETLEISGKADLEKPHDGLAHLLVYAPPTLRHWQDAYDDIEAFKRTLQHEGLTRGFLSTALGRLPVIESKSGIRAEIEHRRTWVPDNYFSLEGFDDDDEEDEEDDE